MNEAGKADCQPPPQRRLAARSQGAGGFRGYRPPFSGTLSPVLPNDDNQNDISELPTAPPAQPAAPPREVGGREGPEPTRFGDWELRGRCIDF
jgi:Protein of unknown function (DUF1674)